MANLVTDYFKLESFLSSSLDLLADDFRLNAEYYTHANNYSLHKSIQTVKLSHIANVIGFGPFKRFYINNIKYGVPLISSSEMMELNPACSGIISKEFVKDYKKYIVKEKTILVSCSGTIGNVTIVDSRLANKAVSQHALRIIPLNIEHTGLIYTFLTSEYGQSLVTGKKSGAVIDEIYEDDLNKIDIPLIEESTGKKINNLIFLSIEKRDIANKHLNKAQDLVLQYNNLHPLSESEIETIDLNIEVEIRSVNISEFTTDYRLDAHFYNPMAVKVVKNIEACSSKYKPLFELSDCSFRGSRSTRNYVDKDHGTPFLSGKNIVQIRPDLKYLSNSETSNMQDMLVAKNWILITRSGTLGRTVFVWNNYENFAASEHLIRVVPFENEVDQGYLYAFLSSDYGYHQLLRYKHGSVIDEITEDQISKAIIPFPTNKEQKEIGDLVRKAYDLRAEATKLEDEAQEILTHALTGK